MNISPDETLKEGYCRKSPPKGKLDTNRWRRRYCILCYKVPQNEKKRSVSSAMDKLKIGKRLSGKGESPTPSNPNTDQEKKWIFCYFEEKPDQKSELIKEFWLEGSAISNMPNGFKNYDHVLNLRLSEKYDRREIYLCFETSDEHRSWMEAFEKYRDPFHPINYKNTSRIQKEDQNKNRETIMLADDKNKLFQTIERAKLEIRGEDLKKETGYDSDSGISSRTNSGGRNSGDSYPPSVQDSRYSGGSYNLRLSDPISRDLGDFSYRRSYDRNSGSSQTSQSSDHQSSHFEEI